MLTVGEVRAGRLLRVGFAPATGPIADALGVPDRTRVVTRRLLISADSGPVELAPST